MLLAPFAAAANVTTFGDGNSTEEIELRDGSPFIESGMVHLPSTETVTSASVDLSTSMLEHSAHSRIDLDTMPRVWNPMYNNQLTQFSSVADFVYEEGSNAVPVQLKSEGFLTDFEETTADFTDLRGLSGQSHGWDHGSIDPTTVTPNIDIPDCASGTYCWGTGLYDDDYTSKSTGFNGRDYKMVTDSIFIDSSLKNSLGYFDSWHELDIQTTSGTNPQTYFRDCAYLEIRSSQNDDLDISDPNGFEYLEISLSNSSLNFGAGYYSVSSNQNTASQIDSRCNGVAAGDGALGGTSTSASNPTGWGQIAFDLGPYMGQYVQIRFVMEDNDATGTDGGKAGWYVDNFRVGDPLPASANLTINGFLPSISGGPNQPNGYGILTLETKTTSTATITVDVLDSSSGSIVYDRNGHAMTNLQGDILELWDINSTLNPS
ncbi:hypothetical protein N9Y28_03320 [Euryarchaeota archaeon]|nr:hypothetical protein [Euryarchaeota archaeon]